MGNVGAHAQEKFEIRMSKSETNPNGEIQIIKTVLRFRIELIGILCPPVFPASRTTGCGGK
jgi:hypothetical protein